MQARPGKSSTLSSSHTREWARKSSLSHVVPIGKLLPTHAHNSLLASSLPIPLAKALNGGGREWGREKGGKSFYKAPVVIATDHVLSVSVVARCAFAAFMILFD